MEIPAKVRADWQCKLVLIGDTSVGKTCIVRRYTENVFSPSFVSTIGIDFKLKMITIGDHLVKVQIWDTAGQEKFRSITTAYYRGAKGILIVYDTTNIKTFEHIEMWIRNINRWANEDTECVIVGNKCDLEGERQVTTKQGEKIAREHNMTFIETSAKNDLNIDEAFITILKKIVFKNEDVIQRRVSKRDSVILPEEQQVVEKNQENKCCRSQ